jgi:hypothetical protein
MPKIITLMWPAKEILNYFCFKHFKKTKEFNKTFQMQLRNQ